MKRKGKRIQREAKSVNYSLSQSLPIKRRWSPFTGISKQTNGWKDCFICALFQWRLKREKSNASQGVAEICFWLFRFQFFSLIESQCPFQKLPYAVWSVLAIFSRWHATWARTIRYFLLNRKTEIKYNWNHLILITITDPDFLFSNSYTSHFLVSGTTWPTHFQVQT